MNDYVAPELLYVEVATVCQQVRHINLKGDDLPSLPSPPPLFSISGRLTVCVYYYVLNIIFGIIFMNIIYIGTIL